MRPAKIRRCTADDNAPEVGQFASGGAKESLEGGVIFLGRRVVVACSICQQFRCVFERMSENNSAVVDPCGGYVAFHNRRVQRGRGILITSTCVIGTIGLGGSGVGQVRLAGKTGSHRAEVCVDLEHLFSVDGARIFAGEVRAQRGVSSRIRRRGLPNVDLVLQSHQDGEPRSCRRASGGSLRVDARDASHQEVYLGQVE